VVAAISKCFSYGSTFALWQIPLRGLAFSELPPVRGKGENKIAFLQTAGHDFLPLEIAYDIQVDIVGCEEFQIRSQKFMNDFHSIVSVRCRGISEENPSNREYILLLRNRRDVAEDLLSKIAKSSQFFYFLFFFLPGDCIVSFQRFIERVMAFVILQLTKTTDAYGLFTWTATSTLPLLRETFEEVASVHREPRRRACSMSATDFPSNHFRTLSGFSLRNEPIICDESEF
jgi:hypothetical protein